MDARTQKGMWIHVGVSVTVLGGWAWYLEAAKPSPAQAGLAAVVLVGVWIAGTYAAHRVAGGK